MARKTTKKAAIPQVKESAQQIWLAGLGAFAMAGEEGSRLFDDLVQKGHDIEKSGKARLEQALGRVRGARTDAREALGRVTAPIDDATSGALHKLGVPTRKEIQSLTKRVEELTRVVEARGTKRAPARKKATKKTAKRAARK